MNLRERICACICEWSESLLACYAVLGWVLVLHLLKGLR